MKTKSSITRRDFLKIIAVSGVAGLAIKYGMESLAATNIASETRMLMGTVVNIKVIGSDLEIARRAVTACLNRMEELENILSRFKPESQLSQLNRDGNLTAAHPTLIGLVQQSLNLSQLTGGAFDITVKPLLDLYQSNSRILPTVRQTKNTLDLVDYRKIDLDSRSIAFQKSDMSITLDGIAKGYIVDAGVEVLKEFGFANILVEAGGDLMALGEKSPQAPWKIGLQAPRADMGDLMATFKIQNQAIATSGDYMQAFTSDFANHHIIDPRTGYSSPELASVSIFTPTAALADGLATAVMVMGRQGLKLIEELPDCEAYAIAKNLDVLTTSGLA